MVTNNVKDAPASEWDATSLAAVVIQRYLRGWKQRREFLLKRSMACVIQRSYRRYKGGTQLRKLNSEERVHMEYEKAHRLAIQAALRDKDTDGLVEILESIATQDIAFLPEDCPALIIAAVVGVPSIVTYLLDAGHGINECDSEGLSALDRAAGNGDDTIIELLLERGGVSGHGDKGKTALHWAAVCGYDRTVQLLLDHPKFVPGVTTVDDTNLTPLHCAAYSGSVPTIDLLVSAGADVNAFDHEGRTALAWAITGNHQEAINRVMGLYNSDVVKDTNQSQESMLHHAAMHTTDAETTAKFIEMGADVDQQDEHGMTPLMIAAENGAPAIAKVLIDNNANINMTDVGGRGALHFAALSYQQGAVLCAELLFDAGVDPSQADKDHAGAVHFSAAYGTMLFMGALLHRFPSQARSRDGNGRTPSHWSSSGGHVDILKQLCPWVPHFNDLDNGNLTPIDCLQDCVDEDKRATTEEFLRENGARSAMELSRSIVKVQALWRGFVVREFASNSVIHHSKSVSSLASSMATVGALESPPESPMAMRRKTDILQVSVKDLYTGKLKHGTKDAPNEYTELSRKLLTAIEEDPDLTTIAGLIESGADVNYKDEVSGRTALHFASHAGEREIIELALEHGADASAITYDTLETPLITAVKSGNAHVIEPLVRDRRGLSVVNAKDATGNAALHWAAELELPAAVAPLAPLPEVDVDILNAKCQTPVLIAAEKGDKQSVGSLIFAGADVNYQDVQTKNTALHYAVKAEDSDLTKLLMESGADPGIPNAEKATAISLARSSSPVKSLVIAASAPLHGAIHADDYFQLTSQLRMMKADADVNMIWEGETPLQLACRLDRPNFVQTLCAEPEIDIGVTTEKSPSPLHVAVLANSAECVKVLLGQEGIVSSKDTDGRTPLEVANQLKYLDIAAILLQWQLQCAIRTDNVDAVRELVKLGASIPKRDAEGVCATVLAARHSSHDCLRYLIREAGASTNCFDKNLNSLLHWAAQKGPASLIGELCSWNATIDARNTDLATPLHLSAGSDDSARVRVLVNLGADILAQDVNGQLPLDIARTSGSADACDEILAAYPKVHAAIQRQDLSALKKSLEGDGDVNGRHGDETPLIAACKIGFAEGVALLIDQGAAVNSYLSKTKQTALHIAAGRGDDIGVNCIQHLVNAGASDMQQTALYSETPVHIAAKLGDANSLKALFAPAEQSSKPSRGISVSVDVAGDGGADSPPPPVLSMRNVSGATPLHLAAGSGKVDAVKLLLEKGAQIDLADRQWRFPLFAAVKIADLPSVKAIADASYKCLNSMCHEPDDDNMTILDLAKQYTIREEVAAYLKKTLADHPGDTDKVPQRQRTVRRTLSAPGVQETASSPPEKVERPEPITLPSPPPRSPTPPPKKKAGGGLGGLGMMRTPTLIWDDIPADDDDADDDLLLDEDEKDTTADNDDTSKDNTSPESTTGEREHASSSPRGDRRSSSEPEDDKGSSPGHTSSTASPKAVTPEPVSSHSSSELSRGQSQESSESSQGSDTRDQPGSDDAADQPQPSPTSSDDKARGQSEQARGSDESGGDTQHQATPPAPRTPRTGAGGPRTARQLRISSAYSPYAVNQVPRSLDKTRATAVASPASRPPVKSDVDIPLSQFEHRALMRAARVRGSPQTPRHKETSKKFTPYRQDREKEGTKLPPISSPAGGDRRSRPTSPTARGQRTSRSKLEPLSPYAVKQPRRKAVRRKKAGQSAT